MLKMYSKFSSSAQNQNVLLKWKHVQEVPNIIPRRDSVGLVLYVLRERDFM